VWARSGGGSISKSAHQHGAEWTIDFHGRPLGRCEPLEASSRKEIEIRAATVWAGELMRRELVTRCPQITPHSEVPALHIDYWLWREGQTQGPEIRPYHRTRTIYY
jgi:hypothetical protein